MRVLLIAICLISYAGQNQSQTANHTNQTDQEADAAAKKPAAMKEAPSPAATPTPQQEKPKTDPESKPWLTHGEWVMAILTGAYVVISLLAFFAIKRQADLTERQAEAAGKQFTEEIAEVRETVKAAKESAQAAHASVDSIRNIERCWVLVTVVHGITLKVFYEHGSPVQRSSFSWFIANHGKTPAIICGVASRFKVVTPVEFEAMKTGKPDYGTISVVPNNSIIVAPGELHHEMPDVPLKPRELTDEEQSLLADKQMMFIAYGVVQYRDVFKDSEIHESRFIAGYSVRPGIHPEEFLRLEVGEYSGHT